MEQDYDDMYENYDICYECRGLGDDYYFDDDGELQCSCDRCLLNPDWRNDYGTD